MTEPTPAALPPGPDLPPLMQEFAMRTRQRDFVLECRQKYGDAFTLRLPGSPPVVFVTTPDAARDLLALKEEESFHSAVADQLFLTLMGKHSLLLLRGPAHKRMRDMLIKPFASDRNDGYARLLQSVIADRVEALPRGTPVPMYPALEEIAWNCIVRLVLGSTDAARVGPVVTQLQQIRNVAIHSVLFKLLRPGGAMRFDRLQRALPWVTPWGRFLRRLARLNALFASEIEKVRGEPDNPGLLAMVLRARDAAGQPMSGEEIRDSLVVLITGGVETVASTAVQLLFRLLDAPEAKRKLTEELEAPTAHPRFSWAHLQELTYLDWVVKESMRLDPAFCMLRRALKVPKRIGGIDIPADTTVAVSTYAIHHTERLWPDADRFSPERFETARPGPFDVMPFGAGPHRCPGANIGVFEVKLMLAHLLTRFDLSTPQGFQGSIVPDGPVWSVSGGLPLILRERTGAAAPARSAAAAS